MMQRIHRISLVIPFLLAACTSDPDAGWEGRVETRADGVVVVRNPAQGLWREGQGWRVEEDLRIGNATGAGPAVFGEVMAVEADAFGRVWVLDRQARQLRVFDARGRYVRSIGREGDGPGELRDPVGLAWAPDGTLWVADPAGARFTVFDTAGRFIDTHPRRVSSLSIPWRGGFGPDGLLYEIVPVPQPGAAGLRQALLRFDAGLEPLDTLALPPFRGERFELGRDNGFTTASVPFAPEQVVTLDPRGFVWSGVSDRYRVVQHRHGGDTVRVVEREAAAVPVTAAERDEAVRGLAWFTEQGGRVEAGRIPREKPAFSQVLLDPDGGFWVRPALPAGTLGAAFDVFDEEGRYLGPVMVPGGMDAFPQPVIRGGAIYGVVRDSLDVPQVVRARIVKGG